MTKIAILGDFNSNYPTLVKLDEVLKQISVRSSYTVHFEWVSTDVFDYWNAFNENLSGLLIAPGSPYKDSENVLGAISYTRINKIPTLGNCGGFQHMLIEFAKNVCGIKEADHEETNPEGAELVISKLACSLVGETEIISISNEESIIYNAYKTRQIYGKYHCNYSFNETFAQLITDHGMKLTSFAPDGSLRAFELAEHPYFVGTLFQPALTSDHAIIDPLLLSFVDSCKRRTLGEIKHK